MNSDIIRQTEQFVKSCMYGVESGHNWWHVHRVRNMALYISRNEMKGDEFIIEMASLLHDIGDYKLNLSGIPDRLRAFLNDQIADREIKDKISYIIGHVSFRDSFGPGFKSTPELDIVQDADRLDALGAIGIARAFNYGGSKGLEIYDPEREPKEYVSMEEYVGSDSSTINHFYEKLLRLKDMMNTKTGRQLADERHEYMEGFLERFFKELSNASSTAAWL